jgi:hypothetical protein
MTLIRNADEKRTAIFAYLNDFCNSGQEVDFAVLLKGKWGAGKTHLIDAFIKQRKGPDPLIKDLYISLNGLENTSQIDQACFKALHPILGSKAVRIGVEALKAGLRTFKFDIDNVGSSGLPVPELSIDSDNLKQQVGVVVFDDLERCKMSIQTSLGYINYFIEQLKLKVVIIANEDEIIDNKESGKEYLKIKEKFIGRTIGIESDVVSALSEFISYISDDSLRKLIVDKASVLVDLYEKSKTDNLRILKQSLWDFERFYGILDDVHKSNAAFFDEILKIIISLSFEMRAGRLSDEQLSAPIPSKVVRMMRDKHSQTTVIDAIEKRYLSVNLDNIYMNNQTLTQFLFDGWAPPEKVRAEINQSSAFAPPQEIPSWKIAANVWHITDDEAEGASNRLVKEFEERAFTEPAELFMVIAIMMLLSDIGIIGKKKSKIISDARAYVDYLFSNAKIRNKYRESPFVDFFIGWGGYAFPENSQKEMGGIYGYYLSKVEAVSANLLPSLASQLLDLMKVDAADYMRSVCVNNIKNAPYSNVPIFAAIEPKSFVERVLELSPSDQSTVLATFRHRYENNSLNGGLADEREWLEKMTTEFKKRIRKERPVSKFRLERALEMYVEPFTKAKKVASS